MNAFVECRFFFGFDKGKKHNDSKSKSQLRLRLRPTQWKKVLVIVAIQMSVHKSKKKISNKTYLLPYKKNDLGYFQVNSEILETRISSSSKFVPQKKFQV